MEKHNLDKLFEDKLANHEIAPGAVAWDEISRGLDKKRRIRMRGWLSIAASAAMLIASGYLLIQTDSTNNEDYYVKTTNKDIAPDVPIYETQLPVFIRQSDHNRLATSAPETSTSLVIEVQNKQENDTFIPIDHTVATTDNVDGNLNVKPILDSELLLVNPILLGAESAVDENDVSKKEEQPVLLASSKEVVSQPVTIIYKQGEVKEQSKISKALNFMSEVGKREKKLIDMNKIKTNLFSKNKEQVDNSK